MRLTQNWANFCMTKVKLLRFWKGKEKGYLDFQNRDKEDYLVRTIYYLIYIVLWLKGSQSSLVGGGEFSKQANIVSQGSSHIG